ncbi:MAG: hypothetical protein V4479_14020 [Actinomycetota bacterium]
MATFNPVSSQLLVAINRSSATRTPFHIRFSNQFAFTVSAALVAFVTVLTIGVSAPAHAAQSQQQVSTQTLDAFISLVSDENTLATELSVADGEIAAAQQVLAASSGKTLDETARTMLAGQLTVAMADESEAQSRLAAWKNLNAVASGDLSSATTQQLLALRQPVALSIDLTAVEDVNAAVVAWNAEQARLAAEAAQAAAEAAAAAAAHPRHVSVSVASAGESVDKAAIAESIFAGYGFSNYVFDGGQTQGHYGATDMNRQVIYLQLSVIPASRVASVALHEYQHILQAREYGGYAGTVAYFGSVLAMEEAADCGALAAGATWVGYGCH